MVNVIHVAQRLLAVIVRSGARRGPARFETPGSRAVLCAAMAAILCDAMASERMPWRSTAAPLPFGRVPAVWNHHPEPAFPGLRFEHPVILVTPPGETNRLFVGDHSGRIWQITPMATPTKTLFMDLRDRVHEDNEGGLQSLAFHPDFASNGRFFVSYMGAETVDGTTRLYDRVSSFKVMARSRNHGDPGSEQRLIDQYDRHPDHNLGDLHFGPDGYLYISMGDEGGSHDQFENGQRIDHDFFAGLLRIDVDFRSGNRVPNPHPSVVPDTYLVPADNPWVGATGFRGNPVDPSEVRTEFYAVGFRNPWRFGFDPLTGELYSNDTGDQTREEVDRVVKGGNYGYPIMEGRSTGPRPAAGPPGDDLIPPLTEYGREVGGSIAAGFFYRGDKYPEFDGAWLVSDYSFGFLGAMRFNADGTARPIDWFTWDNGTATYALDPSNGDILLANFLDGTIHRLMRTPEPGSTPLPPTLADAHVFDDLATLRPVDGVVPYEINVPFWSDGAQKQRWFSLPDASQSFAFNPDGTMYLPPGTTFVKHFELEMIPGVEASRRRIETRVTVLSPSGIAQGFSYRWDDSQTNATLVPSSGLDETFAIQDGGQVRTQRWHFPARQECVSCHNVVAGPAPSFVSPQLNRDLVLGDRTVNQLVALSDAGYLEGVPASTRRLPVVAHATNTAWSLGWRARSFLAVNCAPCHQSHGLANRLWKADLATMLGRTELIRSVPYDDRGDAQNLVIAPGSAERSVLFQRLASLERGHMPPIGTSVLDETGIALIRDWIEQATPSFISYHDWIGQVDEDAAPTVPPYRPYDDFDDDGTSNEFEWLSGKPPGAPSEDLGPRIEVIDGEARLTFHRLADRDYDVQWSTDPDVPGSWGSLDDPENGFFLRSEDSEASIPLPAGGTGRFFRVQLNER